MVTCHLLVICVPYSDMLVFLMLGFLSYSTVPVGVFVVWVRLGLTEWVVLRCNIACTLALECDDHLSTRNLLLTCAWTIQRQTDKVISNFSMLLGFIPSLFNFTFGFVLTFWLPVLLLTSGGNSICRFLILIILFLYQFRQYLSPSIMFSLRCD